MYEYINKIEPIMRANIHNKKTFYEVWMGAHKIRI